MVDKFRFRINFVFNSNLYVGKEGDDYTLEVNNKLDVKGNLNVYNQTFMNKAEINTAIFNNDIILDNDIHINKDVILGGDVKVNEGDLLECTLHSEGQLVSSMRHKIFKEHSPIF